MFWLFCCISRSWTFERRALVDFRCSESSGRYCGQKQNKLHKQDTFVRPKRQRAEARNVAGFAKCAKSVIHLYQLTVGFSYGEEYSRCMSRDWELTLKSCSQGPLLFLKRLWNEISRTRDTSGAETTQLNFTSLLLTKNLNLSSRWTAVWPPSDTL